MDRDTLSYDIKVEAGGVHSLHPGLYDRQIEQACEDLDQHAFLRHNDLIITVGINHRHEI
jgi:hypothetical protein